LSKVKTILIAYAMYEIPLYTPQKCYFVGTPLRSGWHWHKQSLRFFIMPTKKLFCGEYIFHFAYDKQKQSQKQQVLFLLTLNMFACIIKLI